VIHGFVDGHVASLLAMKVQANYLKQIRFDGGNARDLLNN